MENRKDIKIGTILQSTAEHQPKYQIFFSDSLQSLKNEALIGYAENFQDACQLIKESLNSKDKYEKYWRFICYKDITGIDYGSWFRFAIIIPAVRQKEIMGESEE